ncbi:TGF-beta-activated kinase 1 and MAP3K7-binding protein 1-like [Clavelina lepadiformis]|uniref:PPM-type phosphatase domain-containing protein n=1 Tax=Clavelina lepadiformis TaxID=159417 RepID=A0ABP0FIU7_CLALP
MSTINTPDTGTSSTPSPNRRHLQRSEVSWTDDLPQCQLSDVGVATNVVYLADGSETEAYPYEDRAFNFATDYDCYLYGVFDGHDGSRAAHFASERLPAELLLGQLTYHVNETSVKNILQQAFSVVERGFFESIDNELARKTHLQSQLPDRLPPGLAEKRFPGVVQQIKDLNDAIKGGTTAVVALVVNNQLYVANVGDSRALLCQRDQHGRLDIQQISANHDINNEQELSRLSRIGLNIEKILERGKLGMNECTRCIGDYTVKGGYKENLVLRNATCEPVISAPDIYGGIPLSEIEGGFLVLMSDDVYKSLEQATGTTNANGDIASMVSHELLCRNRIEGVAQNVIEKIAYLHRRGYGKSHTCTRGDITLVVRNISHPLGTDALPDISPIVPDFGRRPASVPYNDSEFSAAGDFSSALPGKTPVPLSLKMPGQILDSGSAPHADFEVRGRLSSPSEGTPTNLTDPSYDPQSNHQENDGLQIAIDELYFQSDPHETIELDADNKVAPYVSFANFDEEAWFKMQAAKSGTNSII